MEASDNKGANAVLVAIILLAFVCLVSFFYPAFSIAQGESPTNASYQSNKECKTQDDVKKKKRCFDRSVKGQVIQGHCENDPEKMPQKVPACKYDIPPKSSSPGPKTTGIKGGSSVYLAPAISQQTSLIPQTGFQIGSIDVPSFPIDYTSNPAVFSEADFKLPPSKSEDSLNAFLSEYNPPPPTVPVQPPGLTSVPAQQNPSFRGILPFSSAQAQPLQPAMYPVTTGVNTQQNGTLPFQNISNAQSGAGTFMPPSQSTIVTPVNTYSWWDPRWFVQELTNYSFLPAYQYLRLKPR